MHHFRASSPKWVLTPPKKISSHISKILWGFHDSHNQVHKIQVKRWKCFLNFSLIKFLEILLSDSFLSLDLHCFIRLSWISINLSYVLLFGARHFLKNPIKFFVLTILQVHTTIFCKRLLPFHLHQVHFWFFALLW